MTKIPMMLLAAASVFALSTAARAATDNDGANFLKAAIQSDNSEIMLGKMAAENPTASLAVKRYGELLIKDHSEHLRKAQALAQANGIKPPSGTTLGADSESAKLHLLKGDAFNKEFAQYMMSDHQKDIGDFKKEAARHDGDVSKFAEQSLPTLRKHLDGALGLEKR